MSTHKYPMIRYRALDRCFGNKYRNYAIWDLVQACNDAIYDATGNSRYKVDVRRDGDNHDGIKKRQVYLDIKYMESEAGWIIELQRFRNDRREQCYRYADPDFSINNSPLTHSEYDQLKHTVTMLNRFHGMPQFEWMADVLTHLEEQFGLCSIAPPVVGFEQNVDLQGLGYLKDLFGFITHHQPLLVHYHTIHGAPKVWTIHPYYLKEFNNRWFLFGWCGEVGRICNLALDRIDSMAVADVEYRENMEIDFEEYFDDVIGVTIPKEGVVECVRLRFAPHRYPYVVSKPLHMSQRNTDRDAGIIEIRVIINQELISEILSYGKDVEVLEPELLRHTIQDILENALRCYCDT